MFDKNQDHLFTARTVRIAAITLIVTAAVLALAYVGQNWYLFMTA